MSVKDDEDRVGPPALPDNGFASGKDVVDSQRFEVGAFLSVKLVPIRRG